MSMWQHCFQCWCCKSQYVYVFSRNIAELPTFLENKSWVPSCEIIISITFVLYTVKLERLESVQFLLHILINLTKYFWTRSFISCFYYHSSKEKPENIIMKVDCLALPLFIPCMHYFIPFSVHVVANCVL